MVLPPGEASVSVPGINATTDPELARAAGELAAWLKYLFHPDTNNGPRIYRETHPQHSGDHDAEMPQRMSNLDQDGTFEVVSVLEKYAADPGLFFRSAQAVSGIDEQIIHNTYIKLTEGCLTYTGRSPGPAKEQRVDNVDYPELHPARLNWMEMRKEWVGNLNLSAHEYENDFIPYQVCTENGVYLVAEHLVRYRAIFEQAGKDITKLMFALTDKFAKPNPYGSGGPSFDLVSIVVTGLVVVATSVISGGAGGTAGVLLGTAVTEMLGEAIKTAQAHGTENKMALDDHHRLQDTAQQYLEAVTKIERETADAISQLRDNLRTKLAELRDNRRYARLPTDPTRDSTQVPHYGDYIV
jgi:hypothetical protein